MPRSKSPQRQFREEQAKKETSRLYQTDNPDLDPTRQDAIDKNEVPGGGGPRERAAPSRRRSHELDEEE